MHLVRTGSAGLFVSMGPNTKGSLKSKMKQPEANEHTLPMHRAAFKASQGCACKTRTQNLLSQSHAVLLTGTLGCGPHWRFSSPGRVAWQGRLRVQGGWRLLATRECDKIRFGVSHKRPSPSQHRSQLVSTWFGSMQHICPAGFLPGLISQVCTSWGTIRPAGWGHGKGRAEGTLSI